MSRNIASWDLFAPRTGYPQVYFRLSCDVLLHCGYYHSDMGPLTNTTVVVRRMYFQNVSSTQRSKVKQGQCDLKKVMKMNPKWRKKVNWVQFSYESILGTNPSMQQQPPNRFYIRETFLTSFHPPSSDYDSKQTISTKHC